MVSISDGFSFVSFISSTAAASFFFGWQQGEERQLKLGLLIED